MVDEVAVPAPGDRLVGSPVWRRLLLPRNRSVWVKWAYLPLGAVVAAAVHRSVPGPVALLDIALVWVVAEHLAYQARYLVNDLRDRVADAGHPAQQRRRRLPAVLSGPQLALAWGSVGVRIVLAVLVGVLWLEGPPREAALGFLVGLAVITAVYEVGRDRVRRRAVDPGGRGALGLALPVLLAVPLGYGLRVGAGYHALAPSGPDLEGGVLVSAVLLLQTACVLLAWTLEGTAFLGGFPHAPTYDPGLRRRAHVGVLLVHAGALARDALPGPVDGAGSAVVARDRPVRGRGAPCAWDAAAAGAVLLSVALVALVVRPTWLQVAVLAGGLLAAAAPLLARWVVRPATWLGGDALAVCVGVEVAALFATAAAVLLVQPAAAWLLVVPGVTWLQWAGLRASSWQRGVGPLSLLRRPWRFWRGAEPLVRT